MGRSSLIFSLKNQEILALFLVLWSFLGKNLFFSVSLKPPNQENVKKIKTTFKANENQKFYFIESPVYKNVLNFCFVF